MIDQQQRFAHDLEVIEAFEAEFGDEAGSIQRLHVSRDVYLTALSRVAAVAALKNADCSRQVTTSRVAGSSAALSASKSPTRPEAF